MAGRALGISSSGSRSGLPLAVDGCTLVNSFPGGRAGFALVVDGRAFNDRGASVNGRSLLGGLRQALAGRQRT